MRYYGKWMRDEAEKRIGHLYPKAKLPDGTEATVTLKGQTVKCPNPAQEMMPLLDFVLSSRKERGIFSSQVRREKIIIRYSITAT